MFNRFILEVIVWIVEKVLLLEMPTAFATVLDYYYKRGCIKSKRRP
jgi:hypothetical protein